MLRLSSKISLCILSFAVLILSCSLISAQAQQVLSRPINLRVNDDTLSWDAVTNASGYRVRWRASNRRA